MGKKRRDTSVEPIDLLAWERRYWQQSICHIAGIDEVGRGCLFGDVVAAAVILPEDLIIDGMNDSKKLSEKKRDEMYEIILAEAVAWSVARVDAATIDQINIKQASRRAMKAAVQGLSIQPEVLLIDAEKIDLPLAQESIIKGDANSQSIAAASIVAKVTRDQLCKGQWNDLYPEYGICNHKGYGTKLHYGQLLLHGPTPMHRKSFLSSLFPEGEQLTLF